MAWLWCCAAVVVMVVLDTATRVYRLNSILSPHKKIICDGCSLNLVKKFIYSFVSSLYIVKSVKLFKLKWSNILDMDLFYP